VSFQNVRNWQPWGLGLALLAWLWMPITSWGQEATESQARPAQPSEAAPAPRPKPSGGYYIEFRVGQIGTYGHSYAVYGVAGGKPNYADLHPMGGYVVMALGHVLPVPANTEWDPDVLKLPVSARYRRSLDAAQYQRLIAAVKTAKANKQPYWNAVTYNCNHFIGELAQAIGLKIPGQFQVSYSFVPALRALNENSPRGTTTTPSAGRTASSPPS
jgi:hypothetical protein